LEPPAYKLVISDDEGHTTVVPLLRAEVTIGREQGNTIRLTERNVSRSHARLLRRNGSYVVEDLGSYNGVSVNGARIDGRAKLSAGDQLEIGDYGLAFQAEAAAVVTTIPPAKPRSQPPPRLVVIGEPAAGAEFTLNKPTLRIGRDESLDIWINHKSISHEHAEFQIVDGKVCVFDLESANGMRINGIQASRAVLETGDILQLGEVRFRFLPAEGAHSLVPDVEEAVNRTESSDSPQKPLFALSVIGLLAVLGAGAVFVTLRSNDVESLAFLRQDESDAYAAAAPADSSTSETSASALESVPAAEPQATQIEEPQEWERELVRARRALARGRFNRAYAIANDLPEDSVLRKTPEFGEIRYRYVQSHIQEGEDAYADEDFERAIEEAQLALGVPGITSKQRQEARKLLRRSRSRHSRRIVD
jgi:pSer/pThr/pTyr-binding forkhead associated (FHA) protein